MKCKGCNGELVKDKKRGCFRCPTCHPEQPDRVIKKPTKPKLVGVVPNEGRVREIIKEMVPDMVRDILEDWYIPKPPVTASEAETVVEELRADNYVEPTKAVLLDPDKVITLEVTDWRAKAKEMGISLFHKKKKDVLAEIEAKKLVGV